MEYCIPVLGYAVQERCRHTGDTQAKGHKGDEETGESLI